MAFTKKELSEYMRKLGSKGGASTSKAKREAAKNNMEKINARKRKKSQAK